MIALDTNILLRYFIEDESNQSRLAIQFIENVLTESNPGFITIVAMVELIWVLRTGCKLSAEQIADIVVKLLNAPNIVTENERVFKLALTLPHEDLADSIIHEIGKLASCSHTVTFDTKFAKLSGVELHEG